MFTDLNAGTSVPDFPTGYVAFAHNIYIDLTIMTAGKQPLSAQFLLLSPTTGLLVESGYKLGQNIYLPGTETQQLYLRAVVTAISQLIPALIPA